MRVYTDSRCLKHESPAGFPEKTARLEAILDHFSSVGRAWVDLAEDSDATDRQALEQAVTSIHPAAYVERFERAVARGDSLLDSADNPLSPGTGEAVWGAVAAVLAATRSAAEGEPAFAAVRPPGHHAEMDHAMGFCYVNNVAVAAEWLLREAGCQRVAIFDYDVHHGNGTQHIFEARSDVLYLSTHQAPFYPGTGAAEERGLGAGEGYTVNAPLPAGTGDDGYEEAFSEVILPAIREYRPDVLLISAGFDAWRDDPLGGMRVSEEGFADWGRWLADLAAEVCGGRAALVLEGGYDISALPGLVEGHLAAWEAASGGAP